MFRVEPFDTVTDTRHAPRRSLKRPSRGLLRAGAAVLALSTLTLGAGIVMAADPTTVPSPVLIDPLDPRAGEGASAIGAPLLALLVVIGLGVLAAVATAVFVRLGARK